MVNNVWLRLARHAGGALVAALVLAALLLPGCTPRDTSVTLYTSVDTDLAKRVVADFEKRFGIKVNIVGDTEATKTTGLVQRLISEKARPRADVWWSSEILGTLELDAAGVLSEYTSADNESDFGGAWPADRRSEKRTWYALGARPRVIVYSTKRLTPATVPIAIQDLADPKYKGRIGMARPQFGTTRGHIAAMVAQWGPNYTRDFLQSLKSNGLKLYDGNAAVVRAIADGEIDAGLTDGDDVAAGQVAGWPIAAVYDGGALYPGVTPDAPAVAPDRPVGPGNMGTVMTPTTVALVRGAPRLGLATRLVDYLLSAETERAMAEASGRFAPIRPMVQQTFPRLNPPNTATTNWVAAAELAPIAGGVIEEVFGP